MLGEEHQLEDFEEWDKLPAANAVGWAPGCGSCASTQERQSFIPIGPGELDQAPAAAQLIKSTGASALAAPLLIPGLRRNQREVLEQGQWGVMAEAGAPLLCTLNLHTNPQERVSQL